MTPVSDEALAEIAACPFCGGMAELQKTRFGSPIQKWVGCISCGAMAGSFSSVQSATAAWNHRAPDPELSALRQQVKDMGEALNEMGIEQCLACSIPLKPGDLVLSDVSGGVIHAACCGPERESYVNADGDPLGPNDPIPTPYAWVPPVDGLTASLLAFAKTVDEAPHPERNSGTHLTPENRAQLSYAVIDNFKRQARELRARSTLNPNRG